MSKTALELCRAFGLDPGPDDDVGEIAALIVMKHTDPEAFEKCCQEMQAEYNRLKAQLKKRNQNGPR
jgi:hypothetical protein